MTYKRWKTSFIKSQLVFHFAKMILLTLGFTLVAADIKALQRAVQEKSGYPLVKFGKLICVILGVCIFPFLLWLIWAFIQFLKYGRQI